MAAWIGFSIVYYGFPFPNTAYAKAFGLGISRSDLLLQGLYYLDDSRQRDPITLCVIASGVLVALAVGGGKRRAFMLGGALYVATVCSVPDFLRQQFHTPFYFGGTSIMIVVGVALDTVQQIESHLITRHYEGLTGPKGPRIRGRRG